MCLLVVKVFEIRMFVFVNGDGGPRLPNIHIGRSSVVWEVFVEGQPRLLCWSGGRGSGRSNSGRGRGGWRSGGCSGGCGGGGKGRLPKVGVGGGLTPVVDLSWSAIVGEVQVHLLEGEGGCGVGWLLYVVVVDVVVR